MLLFCKPQGSVSGCQHDVGSTCPWGSRRGRRHWGGVSGCVGGQVGGKQAPRMRAAQAYLLKQQSMVHVCGSAVRLQLQQAAAGRHSCCPGLPWLRS